MNQPPGNDPRNNRMEPNSRVAKKEAEESRNCPACMAQRCHTEEEWKNHPNRGHGFEDGKWSKPELDPNFRVKTE